MSAYGSLEMPPPDPRHSRQAAIIGVGETDFHDDYRASRLRPAGYAPPTAERLAEIAFERALLDAGIDRSNIDGVAISSTDGGLDPRAAADLLGLTPRYAVANGGIMAGPLPRVCADIAAGKADTVAMIYTSVQRSNQRQFGGSTYGTDGATPSSYYYYHPWGWSSQVAHWAMIFTYYQQEFGASEEDLGAVALQVRQHASQNPNAIMQTPLTIDDYMSSRYIVRPLHIFDVCLVNDGAVCLIVSRTDLARGLDQVPVTVAGWGNSKVTKRKMETMVRERLRHQMADAAGQAFAMAKLDLDDVGHFEGYDASTIHLVDQVEGYGFADPGGGLRFCQDGHMSLCGRLPTNTGGGNLSGSYMHGWTQVVECVRQLREQAGARQINNLGVSLSALTQTDQTHPILFARDDR